MKRLFIAALSLMATGCGIYNRYERPDSVQVEADSLYRTENAPDTTSSLASLKWEELFTDPYLQSLIRRGLEANTDLQTAVLRVEEAQATLRSSRLAYLPSVQLDPQGTLSSYDGSKTQKTYSLGGSASWEIDLFGKLTNAKRQSRAALLESEAYRQAMQTQVIATVAESYYSLLMLDEQIRITGQTVESWREYVQSLQALMKAGEADRATLSQAEASRLSAEASLLSLQQQVSEQENALCSFIGEASRNIERGTLDEQQFPQEMSVGLPVELLSRRPDVRQAEASLMQAFYATNSGPFSFLSQHNPERKRRMDQQWRCCHCKSRRLVAASRRISGSAALQPRTKHCQSEDRQGPATGSLTCFQTIFARCRTGSQQCADPMADSQRTHPAGE